MRAAVITPNAFQMLGVPAQRGRTLAARDVSGRTANVVVISDGFWRNRLGGDLGVVGRSLDIAGVPFTIVGVMPSRFVFWDRELWMPLRLDPAGGRTDRRYYVQAQLPEGRSLSQAEAQLAVLGRQWQRDHSDAPEYAGLTVLLRPLVEDVLRQLRQTLYLLLAAVGVLLLVTAANLANAMVAKGMERDRDVAVRRALGASTFQITSQLLIEIVLIAGSGAAIGLVAAENLLPRVVALIPYGYLPAEAAIAVDWRLAAVAAALGFTTASAAGLLPAFRAATIDPGQLIKHGDTRTATRRAGWSREAFMIAQLTLAIVVLAAGLNLARGMHADLVRDPGFSADTVWTARTALSSNDGAAATAIYDRLLKELTTVPGIRDAAIGSALPTEVLPTTLVWTARAAGEHATVESAVLRVSPAYLAVLDIRLREGRTISDTDRSSSAPVVVVTRSLADRLWPGREAVGRQMMLQWSAAASAATVIGVVGDLSIAEGALRAVPVLFVPLAQHPPTSVVLAIKGDGQGLLPAVTRALGRVDPALPLFGAETLVQARIEALGPQSLAVVLMAAFATAVLLLSALGIHAVIRQSIQEREREIWIRLAFGASHAAAFRAAVSRGAQSAAVAGVLGVGLAFLVQDATSAWLPGSTGTSLVAVGVAAAVVGALVLLAAAPTAYRAARNDLSATPRE